LNDPAQLLSIFLGGALGRSGRKRARRAANFMSGRRGFLTASTLMTAAGVAWGIYDSMQNKGLDTGASATSASGAWAGAGAGAGAAATVPPLPVAHTGSPAGPLSEAGAPPEVLRLVRLAVSAARADGVLTPHERGIILDKAREAGLGAEVESELAQPHPMADLVRGLADPQQKQDLYVLAFTIVRADETVSGAERIYLAQLAHQLGLDPATVAALEEKTAAQIDSTEP
jgi:uncharacterized membrane protein YebE (DUF533 family)